VIFCHSRDIGVVCLLFCNHYKDNGQGDRVGVPDLSVSEVNFDLVEDDPHDPTTTSEPEALMQSLNQLPVVTDLVDARSA
jgi:hypothetical protein